MKNKNEDILHSLPSNKLLFIEIALFAIMIIIILAILLDENLAAKYTTSDSATNTGRVAAWSVNVTDDPDAPGEWTTGKTIKYNGETQAPQVSTFTFLAKTPDNGKSNETACRCKVRVVFPQGSTLPTALTMYITDQRHADPTTHVSWTYDPLTNTYTFTHADWDFKPNEKVSNTMTINFERDATKVPKFGNIEGIQVWVDFIQID